MATSAIDAEMRPGQWKAGLKVVKRGFASHLARAIILSRRDRCLPTVGWLLRLRWAGEPQCKCHACKRLPQRLRKGVWREIIARDGHRQRPHFGSPNGNP